MKSFSILAALLFTSAVAHAGSSTFSCNVTTSFERDVNVKSETKEVVIDHRGGKEVFNFAFDTDIGLQIFATAGVTAGQFGYLRTTILDKVSNIESESYSINPDIQSATKFQVRVNSANESSDRVDVSCSVH